MVQNVSGQAPNSYGSINRIGMTDNGRVVYQILDGNNNQAVKMSVAQKDCDSFEKAYRDIVESAPKLQRYAQNTPPEKMQKKQKMAKWIVGGCGLLGGIWPLLKAKGNGFWGGMKQLGLTLLGTGAGLVAGMFIASKMVTPPGAMQFSKATQTLSKLDVQPVE
jgi:hypothetical protein